MTQPATSSGLIAVTAGAAVVAANSRTAQLNSGTFYSMIVTGGAAAGTATLYDGASTAGTALATLAGVPAGTSQVFNIAQGVAFNNGLFIVVSGTTSTAIVHFLPA